MAAASREVKARPILFSGPMVRALLDGRKTQTRRIIKLKTGDTFDEKALVGAIQEWRPVFDKVAGRNVAREPAIVYCPYGKQGDLLWARETWGSPDADHPRCSGGRKPQPGDRLVYRANPADEYQWGSGKPSQGGFCWRPSIHMPRWASRLTLEFTGVRVERLQDISLNDVRAEGCEVREFWLFGAETQERQRIGAHVYRELWESINGAGSWGANPFVWVLDFKAHYKNVDQLMRKQTQ